MIFWRYSAAFAASGLLHLLFVLSAVSFTPGQSERADRTMDVFVAGPSDDPKFPGLQRFGKRERPARATAALKPLALPGIRLDVRTIAARMHVLFPVLTPGLAIDAFFPNPAVLSVPLRTVGASTRSARARPLALGHRDVQSIVDQSWARRGRWQAFQMIAKLMESHAPGGSLPRILQGYREQNALQPYADRDSRDPRLWTQLALAADHVSFIGFIRTYAASHGSTDEATELLLLLDIIVQAEQDALHVLLDTDPAIDLQLTRTSNAGAYALIVQIRQEYRAELVQRGLVSKQQIDAYYNDVRLKLLGHVLNGAVNGYGANDARFLIGTIWWRAGRRSEALTAWRGLTTRSDGSYAASSAALRVAVGQSRIDDREVDDILKNETGRWVSLSYERLRHFGYRFDSY